MEGKLDKGIKTYTNTVASMRDSHRDSRVLLIVTVLYLTALLSMPLENLTGLVWFGIYPVVTSIIAGISFSGIVYKSLWVLPAVVFIGMFNPIIDHTPGIALGPVMLTHGWLTFICITLRGVFAVQALLVLTSSCGFIGMCRAMKRLGMPSFLSTQLEMVYRYCGVLMTEANNMRHARQARGFGKKNMGLKMWGIMIGQLFLRSIDRSQRVHQAMLCRGFRGNMPDYVPCRRKWNIGDTIYLIAWILAFVVLRFCNPELLFVHK